KALAREKAALRRFVSRLGDTLRAEVAALRLDLWLGAASRLTAFLCAGAFLLYALKLLQAGVLSPGTLAALAIYIFQLNSLAAQAADLLPEAASGMRSCERIESISAQTRPASGGRKPVLSGKAEIKNVSFGYDDKIPVLANASFLARPGKHTALLGPSGCGKTTLFNLLLGLYSAQAGQVLVDEYAAQPGRPGVALAPQEGYFWNDSLKNNLLFFAPEAGELELQSALKTTGLDEVCRQLPHGADTILGHNAVRLSRGQKQRLSLARALLLKPRLLLLDEALSSLEIETERRLLSGIKESYTGVTVISSTHRPQSIELADCVYKFDGKGGLFLTDAAHTA
ncbi:MAG TPA: ABC transporter ATP-binding protein, partial [Elusimicrobiales bacterium]|nr:ABC transporter ATP-binding protein [Elusimicrobiales bacterium]